jgi:hypothetical protein
MTYFKKYCLFDLDNLVDDSFVNIQNVKDEVKRLNTAVSIGCVIYGKFT